MTFLNPWFLAGLLGMGIPLVIHLLSRRTTTRVEFSTLEFLRNLERKSMRRVKVRQWLLLALRMLLIAAVAIAMARPTLTGVAAGDARGATSSVIVLDGSWSMGILDGGAPRFDQARDRAREILGTLEDGDEVFLLAPGADGLAASNEPSRDLAQVRERLGALEPGRRAVDLAAAIEEAAVTLQSARHPNREVHLVSDFQRSAFDRLGDDTVLPSGVRLFLHPIGDATPPNAWVQSVDFSGQILETGSPVEFHAVIASDPGFEPAEIEAELEIDGEIVDRRRIDLGPASRVTIPFRETLRSDGLHLGAVTIRGADGPEEDDRRYFTLRAEKQTPVLVVCPDERVRRYLSSALAPEGAAAGTFAVRTGGAEDLASASREREAAIVVADLERFSDAALAGLKSFLSEGGGLLLFPGPHVDAAGWGRTILPKLLPGAFADVITATEPFDFGRHDEGHPLFAAFAGEEGGLPEVRFTRALRFRPQAGTATLASFTNDAPAIVESSLLPGRALMFLSSPDPAWSDLPLTGAFLPLLHESVRYLSETGARVARQLETGEGATVWLATLPEGGSVTLLGPDESERSVAPEAGSGGYSLALPEARVPGFWVFRTAEGDTLAALAASIPAAESDPERVVPAELEERLASDRGAVLAAGPGVASRVKEARVGREIGRAFLWLAGLLLLAEMLVAARMRGAAQESAA
ncbi:MAG: BatA domain-containing protein [Gemmatimonadetes bacterium]|nr:BatA domain-containing protein [Gemmatimonadota bacterium]